jgi:hypothetical protein
MLEYAKPDEAVRDLKENRNDLVLLGLTPAKDYGEGYNDPHRNQDGRLGNSESGA